MTRQTDTQIETAVPAAGTPNRALTQAVLKGIRDMADTIDWDIPATAPTGGPVAELLPVGIPPEAGIPLATFINGMTASLTGPGALTASPENPVGFDIPHKWIAFNLAELRSRLQLTMGYVGLVSLEGDSSRSAMLYVDGSDIALSFNENSTPLTHDIVFFEVDLSDESSTVRIVANDGAFDETVTFDRNDLPSLVAGAMLIDMGGIPPSLVITATVNPLEIGNIVPAIGCVPWPGAGTASLPEGVQDDQWLKVTVAGNYKGVSYEVGERVRVLDAAPGAVEPLKTRVDLTPLEQRIDGLERVVNKAVGTPEIGSPVEVAMPEQYGNGHWLGISYNGTDYQMYKRNEYFSNPQPLTLIGSNGVTTETVGSDAGSDGTHLITTNPSMDFYSGFFSSGSNRAWRLSVIYHDYTWTLIAELM